MNLQTRRMIVGLLMIVVLMFSTGASIEGLLSADIASQSTLSIVLKAFGLCVSLVLLWSAVTMVSGSVSKEEDQGQNYNININAPNSNNDETDK